jgi:hypothetical protein
LIGPAHNSLEYSFDKSNIPANVSGKIKGEIPKALPVCPADAPVKSFNVVALDYPDMKFNAKAPESIEVDFERKIQISNPEAKIYALEEDTAKVASGAHPMPLTLRVNVGDCVKVSLKNKMKESKASFSAIGLAFDPKDSLAPIGRRLGELLGSEVRLLANWVEGVTVKPGEIVLLENCRFNVGEKADDETLSKKIAALCDVYVNDAFGTAHRAEATTHGVARCLRAACCWHR